ncbi:SH3 domain-containing protein [Rhizobium sp. P40RR-XXII]|uniref:SH3 domain-containing protein n=1 Tax=unclassified Rhizobium TaxID=2613769 RepID=UPI00145631C6|nr:MULTISPECIES: SH3 domain-containing protein [unclassified Rhizobium]NLR86118.1 SH3 domain-containing protein [Rhizobium sp. P28RR-XV]NLS18727.1 SH3 domain-containing protein [Rhizobium sp. P40RR-XXII]
MKFPAEVKQILLASVLAAAYPMVVHAAVMEYSKTDVVLRSGPNDRFPAVGMVMAGSRVHMSGCTREYGWCDVTVSGRSGWMPAADIDVEYNHQRLPISRYIRIAERPGIAVVSFDIDTYWSRNYAQLYFYTEIGIWRNIH